MQGAPIEIPDFAAVTDERKRIDLMCNHAMRTRNISPEESLNQAIHIRDLSRTCGYKEGEALSLTIMGYQLWHIGKIEDALKQLTESEQIQQELNYFRYWGETQMVKAMICWGKGNYDQAFTLVFDSLNLLETHQSSEEGHGWLYWTLGVFNYDLKDYKKSLENYEKALSIITKVDQPDANNVSYTLIGIACCQKQQGQLYDALNNFNEALKISRDTGQWMQEARCYYEMGLIAFENGNLEEAKKAQQKSYSMRKERNAKPAMVSCLIALADVEASRNNLPAAMQHMEEALALCVETNTKAKMYQCHEKLSTLHKKTGDFEKALEHNELFHKIRSEIVGEQTSNRLKELETKYATEKSEKEAEIQRLRNVELKKAHDLVAEKNREILDSIQYAKRIQHAILPPVKLVRQYLENSFIFYKPKDIVAGDFYWMEAVNEKVFFTVADCTGHGVPGAMISVMCSNSLSKAVKELGIYEPAKILDKTVELLEELFSKSEVEIKDGMDLALCCLDLTAGKLEYAGANNPLYFIRNNTLNEIKADKQPVGKHTNRQPYTNHSIEVKPDDSFYIFSDGFADQFGGPKGKKFKYQSFKELLLANHHKSMEEQKQLLEKSFDAWKNELEQVDDICVIGLRI